MHLDPNELAIIYNAESPKDKQTLAYAHTITSKINKQELNSVRVSSTLFQIIMTKLGLDGKAVVNKASPLYQNSYKGKDLTIEEWFGVLNKHPELLRAPIAMYKGTAILCNTPTDILHISNPKTTEVQS